MLIITSLGRKCQHTDPKKKKTETNKNICLWMDLCVTGRKSNGQVKFAVFCVRWYLTYRAAKLGGWRPGWWCWKPGRLQSAAAAPRARLPPPGCRPTRSAGSMRSEAPAWGWGRWNSPPRIRPSFPGCPLPALGVFLGSLAGCQQAALKTHIWPPMRCCEREPENTPKITNAKMNITHKERAVMVVYLNKLRNSAGFRISA